MGHGQSRTRTGKAQGPDERIGLREALKAITLWGALEQFEEQTKGSREVGELADMVILSDNPLKCDPMLINKMVVLKTIKEGVAMYKISNIKKAEVVVEFLSGSTRFE